MAEWVTAEGIVTALGVIAFVILPMAVHILRLAGVNAKLVERVEAINAEAVKAERVVGSLVSGVEKGKSLLSPQAAAHLVSVIRETNERNGVEDVVKPVVQAVKKGEDPIAAAEKAVRRVS